MDIRSKVEARKAELREQLARQQERDSQAAQAESARLLARFDEVAAVVPQVPQPEPAPDEIGLEPDSDLLDNSKVDAEIDKELDKRAQNNWTQTENNVGCGLIIAALGSFFISWILGVGLIVVGLIYFGMTQAKHKKKLRAEFDRVLKAKDLDTQGRQP